MSLAASVVPLVQAYDLTMCDLDGVVYRGPEPVVHAVDTINALDAAGLPVAYLTNNASRTAADVASQLRGFGMTVDDADVVTAGEAIASIVAASLPAGSRVLAVGGPGIIDPLTAAGLKCVPSADDHPLAVVQGFHPDVGWRHLAEASYAIQGGAAWFASNLDLTFPSERGTAPGNGSLVDAVRRATGASCVTAGKPQRGLFDETVRRTNAIRPIMVGDRIDTDIVGARRAGIDSLHVLTGIDGLSELVAEPPEHRPQFVAPDLRGLLAPHRPVRTDGARTHCGVATAETTVDGNVRLTSGDAGSLDALRAVVSAAWAHLDTTGTVTTLDASALEH